MPAAGTQERATYDMWCFYIMAEIDAQALYMHRKHIGLKDLYGEAPTAVEAAEKYFVKHAQVISDELAGGKTWLMGETFTAVDILLTHVLTWAATLGVCTLIVQKWHNDQF